MELVFKIIYFIIIFVVADILKNIFGLGIISSALLSGILCFILIILINQAFQYWQKNR